MTTTSFPTRSIGSLQEYLVEQLPDETPLADIEDRIKTRYPDTSVGVLRNILRDSRYLMKVLEQIPYRFNLFWSDVDGKEHLLIRTALVIEVYLLSMLSFTLNRELFYQFVYKIFKGRLYEGVRHPGSMCSEKDVATQHLWKLYRDTIGSRPDNLDLVIWANIPNLGGVEKPADLLPLPNPHLPEFQHLNASPAVLTWITEYLFSMIPARRTRAVMIALLYSVHKVFFAPRQDNEEAVVREILAPLKFTEGHLVEILQKRALTPRSLLDAKEAITGAESRIYLLEHMSMAERGVYGNPLQNIPSNAYLEERSGYYQKFALDVRVFPGMRVSLLAERDGESEVIFDEPIGLCCHTFLETLSVLFFPSSKIRYAALGSLNYELSSVTLELPSDLLSHLIMTSQTYEKNTWIKDIMTDHPKYSAVVDKIASVFKNLRESDYEKYQQFQDTLWGVFHGFQRNDHLHDRILAWFDLDPEINEFLVSQKILDLLLRQYQTSPSLKNLHAILPFSRCYDRDGNLFVSKRFTSKLVLSIIEKGSVKELEEMMGGTESCKEFEETPSLNSTKPIIRIDIRDTDLVTALTKRADYCHLEKDNESMRQALIKILKFSNVNYAMLGLLDSRVF